MRRLAPAAAILAAAALLGGCAAPKHIFSASPAETILPSAEVVLPSRWIQGYCLVEAVVDGRGPFLFLLDTGSAATFVSPRVAAGHEGEVGRFEPGTRGFGAGEVPFAIENGIAIGRLGVGTAEFRDMDAVVTDLRTMSRLFGTELDGILGYPAFAQVLLTIDAAAEEVHLAAGELGPVDGAVVLALRDGLLPEVDLRVGEATVPVVLDSGSRNAIVLDRPPPGAVFASGPVPGRRGMTMGGIMERAQVARLSGEAALGRHVIAEPVVLLQPGMQTVGTGLLSRFRVTFDRLHGKVRLERADTSPIRIEPDGTTGAGILPEGDSWFVRDVVPGSPAEKAGLHLGDHVVSVAGVPVGEMPPEVLWTILSLKGTTVRLVVERAGQTIPFELPVVDLVP
jgi:hypothetical protein